ncbi:L-aspartate oxidase [Aeromicrobium sp. IC_218]|uniref:L-aspartate oxidase n=1 Tax=Aeromicrobium sp. IC_218 TaxID=2545468 RepID=UPI00103EE405|nr:L-aspartate oxidase [Aeromicrobium sp. IC_218]TCI95655.1 L-aspartate oxidase [Aeromicrobium sp. IC_218]
MSTIAVVGSGVAGLTAALEADARGHRVVLLTKASLADGSTARAQGGVAVALDAADVPRHVDDTLAAGAGLVDAEAALAVCGAGPDALADLLARGAAFDRAPDGALARGLEAAHSASRIVHAGGDATGAEVVRALVAALRATAVVVREDAFALDVVVEHGRATGVRLLDGEVVPADAVVLATGGSGQLLGRTTNPSVATGDGVAMALRAGADVADLELVQLHPTVLPDGFLVSEAVRGAGAVLRDASGHRFLLDVDPRGELAPRDVVARAVARRAHEQGRPVVLDATALGADQLAARFPTIDAHVRSLGLDWSREPVPVTPAAHYAMGGVVADVAGRTSLPGLHAVGECACTGLHGANRLASNSLLEGMVQGRAVVRAVEDGPRPLAPRPGWSPSEPIVVTGGTDTFARAELQSLMWDALGVARTEDALAHAATRLATWVPPAPTDPKSAEDANLLVLARATVAAARRRTESRGAHQRADHPRTDPAQARHRVLRREGA